MYRYNNLLSVPELRAEPHRRGPISPEVSLRKIRDQRPAIEKSLLYPKMYFFKKYYNFLRVGPLLRGPRGHVVTGFSEIFPERATGKFGDFARSYLRQARVECTKKNWMSQISPAKQTPKTRHGDLFALSGRSFRAYAGCSATSETGTSWPRSFHTFPDFSGTGHGKNPEVSRQAPPLPHAPAETLTFLENVQHVLILAGSQAQYGESFSLNLCRYCENPPCPVRVCAKWDVISFSEDPVRLFHSGKEAFGRRAWRACPHALTCALTQNKRTALPSATISEMSRLHGPEGDRSSPAIPPGRTWSHWKMLTSPSLPFFTSVSPFAARPSPPESAEGIES
ncbi:hypothetical protein EVAR_43319_1 [Eumeta japonica]|uniref:Uncharacterized protein n=1 Tax=Eumeta variegata TaxID=151549 RepID=A0A4C1WSD4_EUMVA|nr:hypothetical protein EVAR_43319_1 [Eumeta japonica]